MMSQCWLVFHIPMQWKNAAEKAKESANHIIGNNNDYAVTAEMMKIINRDNK